MKILIVYQFISFSYVSIIMLNSCYIEVMPLKEQQQMLFECSHIQYDTSNSATVVLSLQFNQHKKLCTVN